MGVLRRSRFLLAIAGVACSAAAAPAQAGSCELVRSDVLQRQADVIAVGGPLLVRCPGGTTLEADSAMVYQASNEIQLFGNVDYRDPTRTLTSDYATYTSVNGRLFATGNVVFTDVVKGSTLRGPEIEYFKAMPGRPEPQMIAPGRPHLTIVPKRPVRAGQAPPPRAAAREEPLQVDADRVTSAGQDLFSASGNVVIKRSDLDATAAEALHDAGREFLQLRGDARIRGDRFDISGDLVEATMPGGAVDRVVARDRAELVSDRLRVDGPEIQLFFAADLLQRMVSRTHPTAAPGSERPLATARGFRLAADSLDALLPGQQLERVIAIGRAIGETRDTTDTAGVAIPGRTAAFGRIARDARPALDLEKRDRDWVVGDTIIGYFRPREDSTAVVAASEPSTPVLGAPAPGTPARAPEDRAELDRVLAKGSAKSLYRVRDDDAPASTPPALNYLTGAEMEITLRGGQLDVARVLGLERGVYLDPVPATAAAPTAPGAGTPPVLGSPAPTPSPEGGS